MVRIAHLLAWLLMALMPLQSFAAASKMCCLMRGGHTAHLATGNVASAGKVHARSDDPGAQARTTAFPAVRDHKGQGAPVSSRPEVAVTEQELYGCGLCASLCHGVSVPSGATSLQASAPVQQDVQPREPWVTTRPFPVPEKPPRA